MAGQPIRLLVTDLDNTLYDWVSAFVPAAYQMVGAAATALEVPRSQLLDELREVHRHHRDVEHPHGLRETPSAKACVDGDLDPALALFDELHRRHLRLFPGVRATLSRLTQQGVRIVALTDATVGNACFRIRSLGLGPYLDTLYAKAPHHGRCVRQARELARTPPFRLRPLTGALRKPDPRLLLSVCQEQKVEPRQTLYVGDSLARDIAMAAEAGTAYAWARYGTWVQRRHVRQLARLSHFSRKDVDRERQARRIWSRFKPEYTLEGGFHQVLSHFAFEPGTGMNPSRTGPVAAAALVESRASGYHGRGDKLAGRLYSPGD